MTRTGWILIAGLAATIAAATTGPAAAQQYGYVTPGAYAGYAYTWQPGYGWYASYRPRLPRGAGVVVGGPGALPGARGPVGYVTPAQPSTIYADDARRIYAYPTFVYPAAVAQRYGTGCLGLAGCAGLLPWQ